MQQAMQRQYQAQLAAQHQAQMTQTQPIQSPIREVKSEPYCQSYSPPLQRLNTTEQTIQGKITSRNLSPQTKFENEIFHFILILRKIMIFKALTTNIISAYTRAGLDSREEICDQTENVMSDEEIESYNEMVRF